MGLPLREGLAVIYVLADEWAWRERLVKALGGDGGSPLDEALMAAPDPWGR